MQGPYILPFAVVLRSLNLKENAPVPADYEELPVPFGFLRLLLRGALAAASFDEEHYLRLNPDVAAAVLRGEIGSGREHYIANGYFEGRDGAGGEFAEPSYLRQNPDVAAAIRAGEWSSAHEHYKTVGAFELRTPHPSAEEDMKLWRACFPRLVSPGVGD